MAATAISMERPRRGGMVSLKRMMAAPTMKMVMVWPKPHIMPMTAPWRTERSRLTMVETATTWSGSVEWRMPRNEAKGDDGQRRRRDGRR